MKIRLAAAAVGLLMFNTPGLAMEGSQGQRQEESKDRYKKWLQEDVRYIITDEEKEIFQSLTSQDEQEQFVEQFWLRRDPDPRTADNSFKAEHYRRLAYANERFQSGIAGWKTDRGRIYVIHGPPTEIVAYPSGGPYLRQSHEGGGHTSTYPFEIWRYRDMGSLGQDVELEFVDRTWAGEYRLALDSDEKDALMRVPGAGPTLAEAMGLVSKRDRPFFQPGNRGSYPLAYQRAKDSPFARYELISQAQSARPIQYKDLQQLVQVNVSFDNLLQFQLRRDFFRLDERRVLAPITLDVENHQLTFQEANGVHQARIGVYGIIRSITNRIVEEFDDDLAVASSSEDLERIRRQRSAYQKLVVLETGMRYRLDLVLKDVHGGTMGLLSTVLVPPDFDRSQLASSSLVLSDLIAPAGREAEMFVLGDLKVRPSPSGVFSQQNGLGLYLQLYNLGIDQATQMPDLETLYRIKRDGKSIIEMSGETGQGVRLYSDQRAVLVKTIPVERLLPGKYGLEVEVRDRLKGETVLSKADFVVVESIAQGSGPSGPGR